MIEELNDVTVSGGGMVGSVLALLLAQAGFRVQVIDSTLPIVVDHSTPDLKVLAISYASVALLRKLGCWQHIDKHFYVPYRQLETWEWPCSTVVFDSSLLNLPELGFMVENRRLQQTLWEMFTSYDSLVLRCPASLNTMVYDGDNWILTLNDGSLIKSRLLVGADGTTSWVRKQAGITGSGWQYRQSCLLLSIEVENNQDNEVTWQEFHPSGPRAFLPLYDQWRSLVWYDNTARIQKLQMLPLMALKREVQKAFPSRLGQFKLHGAMVSFPLMRYHARSYVTSGLALVGDAAHTMNPLAGQGVNMGFRDAKVLAEVLISARDCSHAWNRLEVLKQYQHIRRKDNLLMQTGIDVCYATFSNDYLPLLLARNFGLMLVQRAIRVKKRLLRYALGLI